MQYKIFDVVELEDGKKATITKIEDNKISGEIVDKNSNSLRVKEIKKDNIVRMIYRNKK